MEAIDNSNGTSEDAADRAKVREAVESAPECNEALRAALNDWATVLVRAVHAQQATPGQADWWNAGTREVLATFARDGESLLGIGTVAAIIELRGMDIEVAKLVNVIREREGDFASRRAVAVGAFVILAWLDPPDRLAWERWLTWALADENMCSREDRPDAVPSYVGHALDVLLAPDGEPRAPDHHWLVWGVASTSRYQKGASPCDTRWAATCVARALGELIDCLDTDRRIDEVRDAVAAFLRTGDSEEFERNGAR